MVKYFPYYFPRLVTNELNAQVSDTTDDATCTLAGTQINYVKTLCIQ